jgi:hypothetical protein
VILAGDVPVDFQLVPDVLVQISPRLIVRSDDERPIGASRVVTSDCLQPLSAIGYLMNASLALEFRYRFADASVCQIVDDTLQIRISLSNDLIEFRCIHSSLLELFERPSGIDRLVLAAVTNQNHPVVRAKTIEELPCLSGAHEARLVEDVELSAAARVRCGFGKVSLKR